MKVPRILVVDDDLETLEALGSFLSLVMKLEVKICSNGSDAIKALDEEAFDIILQDLQMPGIDGFAVLDHAMLRAPQMIRIVATGLVDPTVTKKVEDRGAIFIAKPLGMKVLRLVIEKALAERS